MVSPTTKNGGDVIADVTRTRPAVSGDAVDFASLTPFGDTLGSGIATEYISKRTGAPGTSGWATHGLFPQLDPLTLQSLTKDTMFVGDFSSDLSRGVMHSYTPLTADPNVADVSNLYLRSDTLEPGPGSPTLLTACPACSSPLSDRLGLYHPQLAGATPDLGHIIFEASRDLTPDSYHYLPFPESFCNNNPFAPFICTPQLYEWDHGTLRFVGILPNGDPAPISIAGLGASQAKYTVNTISPDGSKIFFTDPSTGDGSQTGNLYMRLDHTTTVQLNASERTDCAGDPTCGGDGVPNPAPDPGGPQPALMQAVSADGSKVFITSSEQLIDTPGSGDMYVYDTTLPASDPHNLSRVEGASSDGVVLGTSRDGSYLYFGVRGSNPLAPVDLYVWHAGTSTLIGRLDERSALGFDTANNAWAAGQTVNARVTPDGKTLLFVALSGQGLTGYDHGSTCSIVTPLGDGPCLELYRYQADSGSVKCISCNPSGATATGDASISVRAGAGGAKDTSHLNSPLTLDGNHVFFETGERLLPQDVNGKHTDVYEWTADGIDACQASSPSFSASSGGCLYLISTGTSDDDSHFLDATPTGSDVFFVTTQRLVGWDTDRNYDLYDARVDGGFPEPPPVQAECSGEACQGLIPTPPATGAPSSNTFSGSENVVPSVSKVVVKHLTRAQTLKKALRKCKSKHKRSQRRKCESAAKKKFGRSK